MVSWVRAVAPFVAVFVALIAGTDRRLVRTLRSAGALDAARAIPLSPRDPVGRWRLRHLVSRGVVYEVAGRCFLDEAAYAADRSARRRKALTVTIPLVVLIIVVLVVRNWG